MCWCNTWMLPNVPLLVETKINNICIPYLKWMKRLSKNCPCSGSGLACINLADSNHSISPGSSTTLCCSPLLSTRYRGQSTSTDLRKHECSAWKVFFNFEWSFWFPLPKDKVRCGGWWGEFGGGGSSLSKEKPGGGEWVVIEANFNFSFLSRPSWRTWVTLRNKPGQSCTLIKLI